VHSQPDTIRLIVVTTADDVDDEFNRNQPLLVLFNRALHEVGGEGNRDQFALEYGDVELSDLSRKIGDVAEELGWVDGTRLDLAPKPVVV
jgi:hypothetical protein